MEKRINVDTNFLANAWRRQKSTRMEFYVHNEYINTLNDVLLLLPPSNHDIRFFLCPDRTDALLRSEVCHKGARHDTVA